jgi:hypothetical protein
VEFEGEVNSANWDISGHRLLSFSLSPAILPESVHSFVAVEQWVDEDEAKAAEVLLKSESRYPCDSASFVMDLPVTAIAWIIIETQLRMGTALGHDGVSWLNVIMTSS